MIVKNFIIAKAPWGYYMIYKRDGNKLPCKLMASTNTEQEALEYIKRC